MRTASPRSKTSHSPSDAKIAKRSLFFLSRTLNSAGSTVTKSAEKSTPHCRLFHSLYYDGRPASGEPRVPAADDAPSSAVFEVAEERKEAGESPVP